MATRSITALIGLTCLLGLVGCVPEVVYRDRIKEVFVPVYNEPPKAVEVERKVLPVDELKPDSTDQETANAYLESVIILKSENEQLRAAKTPFDKKDSN